MGTYVYAHYHGRVAVVETVGRLYDGSTEIDTGSGFLIGADRIVTANHLVPRAGNFASLQIWVRLGSIRATRLSATVASRDPAGDLAILKLDQPLGDVAPSCPLPIDDDDSNIAIGSTIYALGFPTDKEQSIVEGSISNESDSKGRWQTNALLNVGNSGGPIFGPNADVIGFANAGLVQWTNYDGQTMDVVGVNYFVPARALKGVLFNEVYSSPSCIGSPSILPAPVSAVVNAALAGARPMATEISDAFTRLVGRSPKSLVLDWQAASFSTGYAFVRTKSDHSGAGPDTKSYTLMVKADPGYRITSCSGAAVSSSQSSQERCAVTKSGDSAQFMVSLTSGPASNPYIGWWGGTVSVNQQHR